MSTLLLTKNSFRTPGAYHSRETIKTPFKVGQFFLMFTLLVLGALMSLLYLMEYNGIHTKGYELKKLELERDKLQVQREIKNTNLSKVTSLQHVENSETVKRLIPMRNPVYASSSSSFARR